MEYTHTCRICGRPEIADNWESGTAKRLLRERLCFSCDFWNNNHKLDINGRSYAIVNGKHYTLHAHTDTWPAGHGGRKFIFEYNDGTHVECDNVWYQGEIPEGYWREVMPDNAKIID